MMEYDGIQRLFGKAATAYASACAKHPVFPTVASHQPEWKRTMELEWLRRHFNHNDESRDCTIHSVQCEELLEAIAEAEKGNWQEAIDETLHLIATAMRAIEFYDSQLGDNSHFTKIRKM